MNRPRAALSLIPALLLFVATSVSAQDVISLGLVDNASRATGYYNPKKITLSATKPASVRVAPPGASLQYALLTGNNAGTAGRSYTVALDEPSDSSPTLYVDTNGDGDLTNDPATTWAVTTYGNGLHESYGSAFIDIGPAGATMRVRVSMFRFDPKDPDRAQYASSLFYYADYARRGTMTIGADRYSVILYDEMSSLDFRGNGVVLLIDLNHDGEFTTARERIAAGQPFNIGGTTREIKAMTATGETFQLIPSAMSVPELVPPPDLRPGKPAIAFTGVDIDGAAVNFPKDFAGKVVLLDFWATWCGPCMSEVPGLAATYATYRSKGFDILGVSLDQPGSEKPGSPMRAVMKDKGMVWRQICDGREWDAELADEYLVDSIPHAFLVDGDTGVIIANGDVLRGSSLTKTLETALHKKGKI